MIPAANWSVVPLVAAHLGAMARLADPRDAAPAEARLRGLRSLAGGVSAVVGERFVAGMVAVPVPGLFGSGIAALVPDWGLALPADGQARLFDRLYAVAAGVWQRLGWGVHIVVIPAGATEVADELRWLGFGVAVADAVRPLTAPLPASVPPAGISIRVAGRGDLGDLAPLAEDHDAWYPAAPTFRIREPGVGPVQEMAEWLAAADHAVWIARDAGGRIQAFLQLRPPEPDGPPSLRSGRTIAIGGAFTAPEVRGSGVSEALLLAAMRAARDAGFERMIVDFESANIAARRFWLRHFDVAYLSFVRHIDDRLVGPPGT